MQPARIHIPPDLAGCHATIAATRDAADGWFATADERLSPRPQPGVFELRVSRRQLDRALLLLQAVIVASNELGMEVGAVGKSRTHRAGVAIGRPGLLTPIRVEELRDRVPLADIDLDAYLRTSLNWLFYEDELRKRGWVPGAGGRLRIRLPRRYDRPPLPTGGWRSAFSDQEGRMLEAKLADLLIALDQRSSRRDNSEVRGGRLAAKEMD
jgi:hypothetical protein